jgi:class 3 adenylate cyclase
MVRVRLPIRGVVWSIHLVLPFLALWLLLARPDLDLRWEQHTAHAALTGLVAAFAFAIGGRMNFEAAHRGDARLFLVSMAFSASAGFFVLHALATPDFLTGRNAGFVLATPAGTMAGALFAALSAIELTPDRSALVMRWRQPIRGALVVALVAWLVWTLAALPPLDHPLSADEARGPLVLMLVVGALLYVGASARYFQLHRRRPSVMLVAVITAFALFAEALVAMAYGRSWQLSWWLWHVLLLGGYAFVAYAALLQWRREGGPPSVFRSIALNETLTSIKEEHRAALEAALESVERGELTAPAVSRLAATFDMTERQMDVLVDAADALAHERDLLRRQGALVDVGKEASVIRTEPELLERVRAIVRQRFTGDDVQVRLGEPGPLAEGSVAFPLTIKSKVAGTIEVVPRHGPLAERDEAIYASFASQLSIAIENTRLYREIDTLFRSYLSPDVVTSLLADPEQAQLGGAIQEVTILMGDLRGFTPFSERSSPADVVTMLNAYFSAVVPVVLDHGGTLVQFVGDAFMAMFNAPVRQADHARRAAAAALDAQVAIATVGRARADWPRFRMGINTGPALVGNIGSDELRCYTAIGDTTNLAARLEANAPVGGILISHATFVQLGADSQVRSVGALSVKGKAEPVESYELLALSPV